MDKASAIAIRSLLLIRWLSALRAGKGDGVELWIGFGVGADEPAPGAAVSVDCVVRKEDAEANAADIELEEDVKAKKFGVTLEEGAGVNADLEEDTEFAEAAAEAVFEDLSSPDDGISQNDLQYTVGT